MDISRRRFLLTSAKAGMAPLALSAAGGSPGFRAHGSRVAEPMIVEFESAEIEASIRVDGDYHGVTRLLHKATGRQIVDPRYSALNLFRLFAVNNAMGLPRRMERTSRQDDGWVEIIWPATEAHHGVITARYELAAPGAIDLSITVESRGTYLGYEVFLPSYFDKALVPHVYLKPVRGSTGPPDRVVPTLDEVFRGTVLVFPRDAPAARRCVDGRWERNEFSSPIVQMCPVRHYGYCVAFMKDQQSPLAAVLMADPRDCYAISAVYHAETDADRLTDYTVPYLSLFGDDFTPGDRRTVRARLELVELDREMTRPLELYKTYLASQGRRSSSWGGIP